MSASIYRVEYHDLLNGHDASEFIEKHFSQNSDTGFFYIHADRVAELNKTLTNLSPEDRASLQTLLEATNEHGDFDVSISF